MSSVTYNLGLKGAKPCDRLQLSCLRGGQFCAGWVTFEPIDGVGKDKPFDHLLTTLRDRRQAVLSLGNVDTDEIHHFLQSIDDE